MTGGRERGGPDAAAETPVDAGVPGRGRWAGGGAGVLVPEGGAGRRRRLPEPRKSGSTDTAGGRRGVGMARQGLLQVLVDGLSGRKAGATATTSAKWSRRPGSAGVTSRHWRPDREWQARKRLVDSHHSRRASSPAGLTGTPGRSVSTSPWLDVRSGRLRRRRR